MKRVVTGSDLSQREMRPTDLLDAYAGLVETDAATLGLLEGGTPRSCPGCAGPGAPAFTRLGFPYLRCARCASLFVSPVPDPARLDRFLREGRAERFWQERVLAATADVRFRHGLGPRLHWVTATSAARLGAGLRALSVSPHHPRLDELLLASPTFAQCAAARADRPVPGAAGEHDVVIAFEALERVADLPAGLARCWQALRPGGLLFVSTLSAEGLEVRLLGARMLSLVPPIHLQLLSRAGWTEALGNAGFGLVEYSTPGELDAQAVREACRRDPSLVLPPILDELMRDADDSTLRAFQEVLQQAGLSAHVQLVAVARER